MGSDGELEVLGSGTLVTSGIGWTADRGATAASALAGCAGREASVTASVRDAPVFWAAC